jgi:hypothetical protein
MISPWIKKGFSVALGVTSLVIISVLSLATSARKDKTRAPSIIKAVLKESPHPLPLYGFNGDNTWGPSWENNAFRDSAASLNFKVIRYPGGSVGEYWDWRKGWYIDTNLNQQNSALALPAEYRRAKYSPSGLKQLKLLVDEAHCEVIFTLNMVTKDLDDQLEMLQNARGFGIPIKWVELGNEFNELGSHGRYKYPSPEIYGSTCRTWISALKKNFPAVRVAVIGGDKQFNPNSTDRNWDERVLNEATNADAVVAHIYPLAAKVTDDDGINFESVANAFRLSFQQQGFNNVSKDIWITEFNILWSSDKTKKLHHYALTWGQSLATVLMTSIATSLTNNPPKLIIDHNISGWYGYAAVDPRGGTFNVLPNGIGFGAWCKASEGKRTLRQITFKHGGGSMDEYQVFGWQFKNNGQDDCDLLVNLTGSPVDVDVSALNDGKTTCEIKYAEKNKTIQKWTDVNYVTKKVVNSIIQLPPYSIGLMKE